MADAQSIFNQGRELFEQKRYSDAEQAFRKAIELRPDFADAWYNLGVALVYLDKYDEANRSILRAAKIQPELAGQMIDDIERIMKELQNNIARKREKQ